MGGSHEELKEEDVKCRVLTVSTTRDEGTDKSGKIIRGLLEEGGHRVVSYDIVPDDGDRIADSIEKGVRSDARVLIVTGGTGLSLRDQSVDVLIEMEDRELPGFGELFRSLSYEEIGPRAALSRARGATLGDTLIFVLPGSPNAVKLGVGELVLPILGHAIYEIDKERENDAG